MHGQFVISPVQIGFVAASPSHAGAGIIRDDQLRDALKKFEGPDVGADPILQLLALGGFGVGVVAGPQDGDEDRGWALRTTLRVVDGDRVPGVVNEELLAGLVLLSQHHVQLLPPLLIELAEPAVGIAVGIRLAILFPGQLQRQVRMALEFFVESRKIRSGLATLVGAPWRSSEQSLFQPAIIPAFRKRPSDARRLGAFQIFVNGSVSDGATAGNLPLPQS